MKQNQAENEAKRSKTLNKTKQKNTRITANKSRDYEIECNVE